ncbi:MAG TPA: sigma-70 family RNA polymerase sigma factor [Anaerolineae bacterium]|nr:sigma-70 family RNA polymerase sigma factor [Anaerolineae bacterium]
MHPQPDEPALIAQAQRGDMAALSALYERHVNAIYKFMFYRTGDTMAAEDLTAEVFAAMLTAIARYQERGVPFQAWLFRIARARLTDYWRKVQRREKYHDDLTAPDDRPDIPSTDTLEETFDYEPLRQALRYLTPAEAEVITLRFAGDLDNQAIALVIHSNANAVKSKLRRALQKLREIMERQEAFHTQRGEK